LTLLLKQHELVWSVRDGVVIFTIPEEEETWLSVEVYDVADLVVVRDENDELWDDYDTLIDAITSNVAFNSWGCVGGPGGIVGFSYGPTKILGVAQTRSTHKKIEKMLAKIRALQGKKGDKPPLRQRPVVDELTEEPADPSDEQAQPQEGPADPFAEDPQQK